MATESKALVYHVTVDGEDGPVTFGPNDTVPGWARKLITNPKAWGDTTEAAPAETEPTPTAPTQTQGAAPSGDEAGAEDENSSGLDYATAGKPDLQAEVDKRNEGRAEDDKIVVGGRGNKPDLIKALEADDSKADDTSE